MKTIVHKSAVPLYAVAVVWVLYALLFPLYRVIHFLIVIAASALVYLIAKALCPDIVEEVKEEVKTQTTGNEELDKMIAEGKMAISEMKRLNESIQDETISRQIDRLESVCSKIFAQVQAEPKKLPQIRKFMSYYLPTTLKLLNAYDRMSAAGISGENIDTTKTKVESMMTTIVAAFEKQYDALFGADALDISTDITVLETMMAREGFAGERMEAETSKNADGSNIKLEF